MPSAIDTNAANALIAGHDFRRGDTAVENDALIHRDQVLVYVHERPPHDGRPTLLLVTPTEPSIAAATHMTAVLERCGYDYTVRLFRGQLKILGRYGMTAVRFTRPGMTALVSPNHSPKVIA